MPEKIPDQVKNFISEHIASVADLEGLLMMRENPANCWDARSLAERLYIEVQEAETVLKRLYSSGFLSQADQTYCYKPQAEILSASIDAVAEIYTRSLVPLTNLIHSKSKRRVQEFADAFLIRKDT